MPIIIYWTLDKHVIVYLRSAYNRQTIKNFKLADKPSSRETILSLFIISGVRKLIYDKDFEDPLCVTDIYSKFINSSTCELDD